MTSFDMGKIPFDKPPPWLEKLLRRLQELEEENARLREENARLKGQKGRPDIRPSTLEKPKRARDVAKRKWKGLFGKRKAKQETQVIQPANIPEGSRFKGYRNYRVRDLIIEAKEILFRVATYLTPEGKYIRGELPEEYRRGHFGPELIAYCLQLYHGGGMTQPKLLEHLHELGVEVSKRQLENLLNKCTEDFAKEMEAVRQAGVEESSHLNADDTGARHQGKNGVCTCLGSPLFCYFQSSESKSRLNFLEILRGPHKDYLLDESAYMYAIEHGVTSQSLDKVDEVLDCDLEKKFRSKKSWMTFLKKLKIVGEKDVKLLSEATTLASAIDHGLPEGIPIVSDAAPQFQLWASHALCWIHEERHYRKIIPVSEHERQELEKIRGQIWELYNGLKSFAEEPGEKASKELGTKFDEIFKRTGVTEGLDELLRKSYSRKEGLLQVLKHPGVPLHNNDCERDIREYVKRRKISGTTRSEEGRRARDTFLSLKKTCMKLNVSFFGFIRDRVYRLGHIPHLQSVLVAQARATPSFPGGP